jgi:3-isopropylmalate/(R)-2-methylmalate dehydratase large subunit
MTSDVVRPRTILTRSGMPAVVTRDDGETLLTSMPLRPRRGVVPRVQSPATSRPQVRHPTRPVADPTSHEGPHAGAPSRARSIAPLFGERAAYEHRTFGIESPAGIVHVIGPEQGLSQPGMLIICADSHTSTQRRARAFAFGIPGTPREHTSSRRRRCGSESPWGCEYPWMGVCRALSPRRT